MHLIIVGASFITAVIIVTPFWRIITFQEDLENFQREYYEKKYRQQQKEQKTNASETNCNYYLNERRRRY